jgi:hypothetical protein
MKCPKCETQLEVAPAAYPGEHTASVCRDILAERLAKVQAQLKTAVEALSEYERCYQVAVERSRMPGDDGALAGYTVAVMLSGQLNASTRALEAERARSAALQAEVERMRDALLLIRTRASTFALREDFIDAVFSTPSGIGQPVQSPTSTEKKT